MFYAKWWLYLTAWLEYDSGMVMGMDDNALCRDMKDISNTISQTKMLVESRETKAKIRRSIHKTSVFGSDETNYKLMGTAVFYSEVYGKIFEVTDFPTNCD